MNDEVKQLVDDIARLGKQFNGEVEETEKKEKVTLKVVPELEVVVALGGIVGLALTKYKATSGMRTNSLVARELIIEGMKVKGLLAPSFDYLEYIRSERLKK